MATIELAYGRGALAFEYDEARFRVLQPSANDTPRPLSDAEIIAAMDAPIASPPLEEIVQPGETVLIVVSDATRANASGQIVNLLVRRLVQNGIAPHDIKIIFATGIHRAVTPAEKRELLTPFVFQRITTLDHDAYDESQLAHFDETASGALVELNRALHEHDHIILTGGISFHYFAGFTGGRKSICPGLASAETIAATHALAFDFEKGGRRDGVGCAVLDGNAVHEECERIAALIKPSFLVNTVTDERGLCCKIYAGDWRSAHRQGCADYLREHSLEIEEKRALVMASCGGAPFDINLIQAHKTLLMAARACNEGGAIILLAECADGLGRADFLKWFAAENSRALENSLRERYEVNGQTAWSLLAKAEAFEVYLVSSLPDDVVRQMRMIPARSLEEALAQVNRSDGSGYLLPRGATFLPVLV
ncbi:MAG: nickel-dependent lactate racemase [Pyrinomonadaceae bacterium]